MGQHRVFAYHEGYDELDKQIAPKRLKQQLLVTGVVYPSDVKGEHNTNLKQGFFSKLMTRQTKTKADLRQAIESIVIHSRRLRFSRSADKLGLLRRILVWISGRTPI